MPKKGGRGNGRGRGRGRGRGGGSSRGRDQGRGRGRGGFSRGGGAAAAAAAAGGRGFGGGRGRGRGGVQRAFAYQYDDSVSSSNEDLPLYGQFDDESDTSLPSSADDMRKTQEQLQIVFAEPERTRTPVFSSSSTATAGPSRLTARGRKARQIYAKDMDLVDQMSSIAMDDDLNFSFTDGIGAMDLLNDFSDDDALDDEELALIQDYIDNTAGVSDDDDELDDEEDDENEEIDDDDDDDSSDDMDDDLDDDLDEMDQDDMDDSDDVNDENDKDLAETSYLPTFLLAQQELDARLVRVGTSSDDDDDDDDNDELADHEKDFMALDDHKGWRPRFRGANEDLDDPQFRKTLQDAMEQVPTGLKPGVRNMLLQEKRQAKRQKRLEKKQRRKERKKERNTEKKHSEKNTKKKGKAPATDAGQLRKLDGRLIDFIQDDQITTLHFAPMAKHTRRQLHMLATAYGLKSRSIGTGPTRSPIVTKTERTFLPADRRYIDRFLSEAQSTLDSQYGKLRSYHERDTNAPPGLPKRKSKKDKNRRVQGDPSAQHGAIVGSNAAPIDQTNVGHRLLAAMGWTEGSGLGAAREGIIAPVEAVMRDKRRGLGT
ncbi:hypothetical protein BC940DRAFT_334413 [Gongronella butleri]|nr:hypothetical protein BC940DRAFT_334413 [Gongronella butleri]